MPCVIRQKEDNIDMKELSKIALAVEPSSTMAIDTLFNRGQGLNKPYNRFGEWIAFGLDSPKHYYYRGDAKKKTPFICESDCKDKNF